GPPRESNPGSAQVAEPRDFSGVERPDPGDALEEPGGAPLLGPGGRFPVSRTVGNGSLVGWGGFLVGTHHRGSGGDSARGSVVEIASSFLELATGGFDSTGFGS